MPREGARFGYGSPMTTEPALFGEPAPSLCDLTASELVRLLSRREISAREAVQAHLGRIEAVDGKLRAFTQVFRERALADADRADRERRGPLSGLPVSVKENFDFEGEATTMGV